MGTANPPAIVSYTPASFGGTADASTSMAIRYYDHGYACNWWPVDLPHIDCGPADHYEEPHVSELPYRSPVRNPIKHAPRIQRRSDPRWPRNRWRAKT